MLHLKEEQVAGSDFLNYNMLVDINEKIQQCHMHKNDVNKAIVAGNLVLDSYIKIEHALIKAKNKGNRSLGGGSTGDFAKHSHIDAAEAAIKELNSLAKKFMRALLDVDESVHLSMYINRRFKFFDFIFEKLFADLFLQRKIKQTLIKLKSERSLVNHVLEKLLKIYVNDDHEVESLLQSKFSILSISINPSTTIESRNMNK